MARHSKGKNIASEGNVTFDFGIRAGSALDQLIPAPHRDKAIARLFGVSPRMAKYLRKGRHWTTDRLTQASTELGAAFDAALYTAPGPQHVSELAEVLDRLARLEARIAEMDRGGGAGLAPEDGEAAHHEGRALAGAGRAVGGEVTR